jgi:REP element-mobilizing transposase RayT
MRSEGIDQVSYLVTLWTYRNRPLFSDPAVAGLFCRVLGDLRLRLGFRLHAYVLLPDRVRIIVGGNDDDPRSVQVIVQRLKSRFAREANDRSGRLGLVWEDADQRVALVRGAEIARRADGLHRSPAWARLVPHPAQWRWSSYRDWSGLGHSPLPVDLPRNGA